MTPDATIILIAVIRPILIVVPYRYLGRRLLSLGSSSYITSESYVTIYGTDDKTCRR